MDRRQGRQEGVADATRWRGLTAACCRARRAHQAQAQVGFDRLGGDYTSFPLRSAIRLSAPALERDQRCRAWAFSCDRKRARDLLAQIARTAARRFGLLRLGRARCRRH